MGLKILHVANIAQNAYINALILNDRGHDCDLLAFDVYHLASSPEWYGLIGTAVDISLLGDDPFFPDFYALGRDMPAVGDWVAHGPLSIGMRYLVLKRGGDPLAHLALSTLNYLRFKATLQRTTMPNWAPLADTDYDAALDRYQLDSKLRRRIRTGRISETSCRWVQRKLDAHSREHGEQLYKLPNDAGLIDYCAASDSSLAGFLDALRKRGLSEVLDIEYRASDLDTRALEKLGFDRDEVLPFMGAGPLWRELASHYDVCIFYGDSVIHALTAGLERYWALEHGTIRSIPFEPTPYGRLVAAAYANATGVFLTNTDYATAQTRLDFKPGQSVYAFHPFDEAPAFALRAAHVRRREQGRICFFCPARQDWTANDPKMSKGNDAYFRGAKILLDSGRGNFVLRCIDWGVDREASRALIRDLGLTDHVIWEPIMSKNDLWASMLDAHAIVDQFLLSSFSGVTFESLALGCRLITRDDGIANGVFFAEAPPLLAASDMGEIASQMAAVMDDPEDEAGIGGRGVAWIRSHHSADRLVELQLAAFMAGRAIGPGLDNASSTATAEDDGGTASSASDRVGDTRQP